MVKNWRNWLIWENDCWREADRNLFFWSICHSPLPRVGVSRKREREKAAMDTPRFWRRIYAFQEALFWGGIASWRRRPKMGNIRKRFLRFISPLEGDFYDFLDERKEKRQRILAHSRPSKRNRLNFASIRHHVSSRISQSLFLLYFFLWKWRLKKILYTSKWRALLAIRNWQMPPSLPQKKAVSKVKWGWSNKEARKVRNNLQPTPKEIKKEGEIPQKDDKKTKDLRVFQEGISAEDWDRLGSMLKGCKFFFFFSCGKTVCPICSPSSSCPKCHLISFAYIAGKKKQYSFLGDSADKCFPCLLTGNDKMSMRSVFSRSLQSGLFITRNATCLVVDPFPRKKCEKSRKVRQKNHGWEIIIAAITRWHRSFRKRHFEKKETKFKFK